MKRYVGILIVLFVCSFSMECLAFGGSITFLLEDTGCTSIEYTKVASVKNGMFLLDEEYDDCDVDLNVIENAKEAEAAARKLSEQVKVQNMIKANGEKEVEIPILEEGVYLFVFEGEKMMSPMLVFVPTWMESTKEMVYDITAVPKYKEAVSPETGDKDYAKTYLSLFLISFAGMLLVVRGQMIQEDEKI